MPNDPTTTGTGPWRILILDPDPGDPKLILATVTCPGDVRAAWPASTPAAMAEATTWVRAQTGRVKATLVPLARALAWRIDEHAS